MNVNLFISEEFVDFNATAYAEACISLWPNRELTIQLPPEVDEEAICAVFRAFGCAATPIGRR